MLLGRIIEQMRGLDVGAGDADLAARGAFLEWALSLPLDADMSAAARAAQAEIAAAGQADSAALKAFEKFVAEAACFEFAPGSMRRRGRRRAH